MPRERDERRRERLLKVRRRQTERLQELGVVREPALPVLVPDAAGDFLAVDGQLLVAQADVGRLREILGDGIGGIEPLEGLNVALVSLKSVGVVDALARVQRVDANLAVTPRHLLFSAFKARGQEGEDPEPVDQEAVGAPSAEREALGQGVRVGVIDTGIAEEALTDPWLKNILPGPADLDKLQEVESGTDRAGRLRLDLQAGHGTMVAGVLREVAPGCHVEIIKALDTEGIATEEELARAVQEAVRRRCDIINMSFGGYTNLDLPPLALDAVIGDVPGEVLLVAAAGNFFDDRPVWPAAIRRIVSVAALRQRGDDADPVVADLDWYSSFGWWVDVAAPGKWNTPFVKGVEHPLREAGRDRRDVFEGFAEAAGTSLAAAAVSGAIAVELSRLRAESRSRKKPTARDGLKAVLARPGNVKMRHGTLALDVWER